MKLRATAALVAVSAVISAFLVSAPVEAASLPYDASVKSKTVALTTSGTGKVFMTCYGRTTCRGTINFFGSTRARSFSIPAKKSQYVSVAVRTTESAYPSLANGAVDKGDYNAKAVTLYVKESSPRRTVHSYKVTAETKMSRQSITGQISGPGTVNGMKVDLIKTYRGGNTKVIKSSKFVNGGYPGGNDYNLDVNLGENNSASGPYRLRITGTDKDGQFRSWFYRANVGGQRYVRDSTVVKATKSGDYVADFKYQSISGFVTGGGSSTTVTAASVPMSYSSSPTTAREYDIPYCGDVYAKTETDNGNYQIDFLPYSDTSVTNRYMIGAKIGSRDVFYGAGSSAYGSCSDVTSYTHSRSLLIPLGAGGANRSVDITPSGISLKVLGKASGYTPTSRGDRWIRLREKVPGLTVLQSPVVYEGQADSAMNRTFDDVEPGKYWVEVGRRTGCNVWVPSRFTNNNTYFTGGDRSSDRWRTVAGKFPESPLSTKNGYIPKTPPRGYKGWMYRGVCSAYGAGTYEKSIDVTGSDNTLTLTTATDKKGASVSGRISRSRGGTKAEMMVRLSSQDGKRVLRTAITGGSGSFKVTGLASGTYQISLNSDSWRGSGRRFTGRHTIKVTAGRGYSVGTLRYTD